MIVLRSLFNKDGFLTFFLYRGLVYVLVSGWELFQRLFFADDRHAIRTCSFLGIPTATHTDKPLAIRADGTLGGLNLAVTELTGLNPLSFLFAFLVFIDGISTLLFSL